MIQKRRKSMDESKRLGAKKWFAFVLIGLAGQLAWAIENNYINLWVYSQSGRADFINWMTVASSIVATLTTFLMGALSDRLGKRRIFIAGGYTVWGFFVFAFALASLQNGMSLCGEGGRALLWVGIMNVIIDCVMTFLGSTGNDACFNAMVTEQTNEKNRPFVETVLSVLPLLALVMMMGIGMVFGVPGSQKSGETISEYASRISMPWLYFFLVCGIITTLVGVAGFFILPQDEFAQSQRSGYFKNLAYGFLPNSIKKHARFYIALLAFLFFNIAVDSFMPYYMVYFQSFAELNFYLAMGIIVAVAVLSSIGVGAFLDKIGHLKVLIPAILVMASGAFLLFLSQAPWALLLGGSLLMLGYLIGTAVLGAEIRDQTPKEKAGSLQGVRMVFAVLLPMVIGSNISLAVFQQPGVDAYGQATKTPDHWMFLVTCVSCLLTVIPSVWLILASKRAKRKINQAR